MILNDCWYGAILFSPVANTIHSCFFTPSHHNSMDRTPFETRPSMAPTATLSLTSNGIITLQAAIEPGASKNDFTLVSCPGCCLAIASRHIILLYNRMNFLKMGFKLIDYIKSMNKDTAFWKNDIVTGINNNSKIHGIMFDDKLTRDFAFGLLEPIISFVSEKSTIGGGIVEDTTKNTVPKDTITKETNPKGVISKGIIPKETNPKETKPNGTVPKETKPKENVRLSDKIKPNQYAIENDFHSDSTPGLEDFDDDFNEEQQTDDNNDDTKDDTNDKDADNKHVDLSPTKRKTVVVV